MKSKLLILITALLALSLFVGCAATTKGAKIEGGKKELPKASSEPLTVEINKVMAKGVEESAADVITNKICSILTQRKNFSVRCAGDAQAIMRMKGQSLMMSGDDAEAEQIAESQEGASKADRLIEASLGKVGSKYMLNIKNSNPSTGTVIERIDIVSDTDVSDMLPLLEDALRRVIP